MYPLVVTNPFIDDFPIKTSIYKGFSMVMLNNQRVNLTALRMNRSQLKWFLDKVYIHTSGGFPDEVTFCMLDGVPQPPSTQQGIL